MAHYYTDERNAQIVLALMKKHGIRRVIASPGTTNICLVASMQQDPWFEMYSAPEERSAAYMACGLAAETGEPVALSCTGATASRNYLPGLTEAYYRKLPVLAITSSRRSERIGHLFDQVTDRTQLPRDAARLSVTLPLVIDHEKEWACVIAANRAMLELRRAGGGPVHINLETDYSRNYETRELPDIRAIFRVYPGDELPDLKANKIAVLVGGHLPWTDSQTEALDAFCARYPAAVLCDHTGNYHGKYRVQANLLGQQKYYDTVIRSADLVIHIGEVLAPAFNVRTEKVWRVSPDGELRDPFHKLRYVFEMAEEDFFSAYAQKAGPAAENPFFEACRREREALMEALPETAERLPFSNAWAAYKTAPRLPEKAELHLGIQNSLRFWNFFETPETVRCFSNTGGFGIDGSLSSLIGASLAHPDRPYFCVLGDLAFFYDMNSLGNRHAGSNLRILLVNNGRGTEFRLSGNPGSLFGDDADRLIAAAGHYGQKSPDLVRHYAQDLGFEYLTASDKESFEAALPRFLKADVSGKPLLFEIFTRSEDEDRALSVLRETLTDEKLMNRHRAGEAVKSLLGEKGVRQVKKLFGGK